MLKGATGDLEDNEIFANEHSGVAVESSAAPTIHNNRIHSGRQSGVIFFEGSLGTMSGNLLWGNEACGVEITEGSAPLVRQNRVLQQGSEAPMKQELRPASDGSPGIWIHSSGCGTIEGNEITRSNFHGVVVGQGANPLVRKNRIHANKRAGVFFQDGAGGTHARSGRPEGAEDSRVRLGQAWGRGVWSRRSD